MLQYQSYPDACYSISQEICTRFCCACFVVVMQSFIMNSHEVYIHIHQGCFAGTGAIVRLPQCQWSKPDGYGKISQCITTTKHSKAKTVCIFLGIYCTLHQGCSPAYRHVICISMDIYITYGPLFKHCWNEIMPCIFSYSRCLKCGTVTHSFPYINVGLVRSEFSAPQRLTF